MLRKAFADYQSLLEQVDAVSIVVPTVYHHGVAMACLEQGVDILLEKPMTTSLKEADDLIALADRKKLLLQVGHLERFNPAVLAMQPLLNNPFLLKLIVCQPLKIAAQMLMSSLT